MKPWQVWTAVSLLLMLGGPIVWFFGLRRSELAVQSPHRAYVLAVPRTYFLRDRRVEPIATDRGTVDLATLVAAPIGAEPRGYGLTYVELAEVELERLDPDAILRDALAGGVQALHATPEPMTEIALDGHRGLETRFVGQVNRVPIRGRMRGYYVDGEVVVVMAICGRPRCEDDPDRLGVLDRFSIR